MTPASPPVILIDDNPDDLVLTEELLRKAGVASPIITAPGGEEAIDLFRNFASGKKAALPLFVLCDVRMPGMDGFEVLKWVRSQPRLGEIYFAMHTGGNVPADRARACNLGANEFLVKFPTTAEIRRINAEAADAPGRSAHKVTRPVKNAAPRH